MAQQSQLQKSPAFQRFIQQCAQLAAQAGISAVLIAAKDPVTGAVDVVASPTGPAELTQTIAQKLNLDVQAGEVGWGDGADVY